MDVVDLPVAVIGLSRDRTITAANPKALELLGYESLVGKPADVLRARRPSGEGVDHTPWYEAIQMNEDFSFPESDMLLRRGDNTEIHVLVDGGVQRAEDGTIVGAIVLVRPKYEGARQPGSGVKIVSAVSHELRSPLTSIRGYTALLLKRFDIFSDDDKLSMLGQIDGDARRVTRLINELLDISRIESGRVQLNRTQLELKPLAESVVENVTMSYPELEATLDIADGFPIVWADQDKIIQVLTNLIENACKYASPKGVRVQGTASSEQLKVEVHDHGPGIPAEDLPKMFQQFFKSSAGRPSGTGLGLWISRGLIEAHGGMLTVTSDGSTGSTFAFTLPLGSFEALHGDDEIRLVSTRDPVAGEK